MKITNEQFNELKNNPNKKIQINENLYIQNNSVYLTINQNTYALNIKNIEKITYQNFVTQILIFIDNSFSIYMYDFKTKNEISNRTFNYDSTSI